MEEMRLTPEELAEYEEFKKEKARREAERIRQQNREIYKQLIDELIEANFPRLREVSDNLANVKASILDAFKKAIEMKTEIFETKSDQYSHMFTNSKGDKRIIIGVYTTDNYRDTVNEGIAIVKEAITGLAKDDDTKALVEAILRLLSKDQKGNLKASRVLQLRQLAEKIGNSRLIEGVKIIEESYQPAVSKTYIRAEYKNEIGQWINIPLGMTEA
jgi:Mg2+ and Co2+ transporter CorA